MNNSVYVEFVKTGTWDRPNMHERSTKGDPFLTSPGPFDPVFFTFYTGVPYHCCNPARMVSATFPIRIHWQNFFLSILFGGLLYFGAHKSWSTTQNHTKIFIDATPRYHPRAAYVSLSKTKIIYTPYTCNQCQWQLRMVEQQYEAEVFVLQVRAILIELLLSVTFMRCLH